MVISSSACRDSEILDDEILKFLYEARRRVCNIPERNDSKIGSKKREPLNHVIEFIVENMFKTCRKRSMCLSVCLQDVDTTSEQCNDPLDYLGAANKTISCNWFRICVLFHFTIHIKL